MPYYRVVCHVDFKKKELILCVYLQDLLLKKKASRTVLLFMGDGDFMYGISLKEHPSGSFSEG